MLNKFFNSFLIIIFLVGCETTSPITSSMSYEELELDASSMSTKLDINVDIDL